MNKAHIHLHFTVVYNEKGFTIESIWMLTKTFFFLQIKVKITIRVHPNFHLNFQYKTMFGSNNRA